MSNGSLLTGELLNSPVAPTIPLTYSWSANGAAPDGPLAAGVDSAPGDTSELRSIRLSERSTACRATAAAFLGGPEAAGATATCPGPPGAW